MELQNNRPAYLFVLAKKIEAREVFLQSPQQSDYARKWDRNSNESTALPTDAPSFSSKMRSILPTKWKEALRPFAATISIRHRYPCYQPIDERALLRGEFEIDRSTK